MIALSKNVEVLLSDLLFVIAHLDVVVKDFQYAIVKLSFLYFGGVVN